MHVRDRAPARVVVAVLFFAVALCAWRPARAGDELAASADKVMAQDYADANYGEAKKKLRALQQRCNQRKCPASTSAAIHRGLGMVNAQIGQTKDATAEFLQAMELDPNAQLPESGVTDAVKAAWDAAQKQWLEAHPQPDDATKAGWTSKQGFELAKAAVAAEAAGNFKECAEKDRAALTLEEHPRARLHLAGCEGKTGEVIEGLRDAQKALEVAAGAQDDAVAKAAQQRIEELLPRVAHVQFEVPAGVSDVKVTFDDKPVPPEKLTSKFSINPTSHHVQAEGTVRGAVLTFDQTVEAKDGENLVVKITLKPSALTQGQLGCMYAAKTQEEILKCLPQEQKPLVVHAGIDWASYGDTTHVYVVSPELRASVTSPTAGWNVGATYLVDFVTAASPDIVSEASTHFHDTRHAVTATGGYKPGNYGAQLSAFYSTEADYLSRGAALALTGDFKDKLVTPLLSFSHSEDTIGRTGTPFDVFSHSLATNELVAGTTLVMSKQSLLTLAGTLQIETGDQSKPYRYVPMFAPGVSVKVGADVTTVNNERLGVRPLEQLPLARDRWAVGARYAIRFATSTLRVEERLYTDSWNVRASTTDGRYIYDLTRRLEVWPHVHLHAQTGANFYQRIYNATPQPDGTVVLPAYRTDDRELSPLGTLTLGAGARYAFAAPESKLQYGLTLQGDLAGTRYFNALFVLYRLAYYGTLSFDVEFE